MLIASSILTVVVVVDCFYTCIAIQQTHCTVWTIKETKSQVKLET